MHKISKLWTGLVAYVALVVGAGLSITFNVVDTIQVRGTALDRWDVVTAVAGPAMVVLMVEMFVSRLWAETLSMQTLRWLGTGSIGLIAMRVSWTHGHAFLLSRQQTGDVATLMPISVDLLAVMATALILSGRRTRTLDMDMDAGQDTPPAGQLDTEPVDTDIPVGQPDTDMAPLDTAVDNYLSGRRTGHEPGAPADTDNGQVTADLTDYQDKMRALDTAPDTIPDWVELAAGVDKPAVPVSELPTRRRPAKLDESAALEMMRDAMADGVHGADLDRYIAAAFGVSYKTAYRLRIREGL